MIEEKLAVMSLPYRGADKTVRVFIPAHEEGETLPVVYMTDGQNLFDYNEGQFGCWYTREAVREERISCGRAAVIVGIHNDGHPAERSNDLTPKNIARRNEPVGIPEEFKKMIDPRGEEFGEFIINTLMPEVEKNYPVKTGRENTAFCGSSAGGLESLYMALTYPGIFSYAGVFSPVPLYMIYDADGINSWLNEKIGSAEEIPYLYFYGGGSEPMEKDISDCMEAVYNNVFTSIYPEEKCSIAVKPEMPHNEKAWKPEFRKFLHMFLAK